LPYEARSPSHPSGARRLLREPRRHWPGELSPAPSFRSLDPRERAESGTFTGGGIGCGRISRRPESPQGSLNELERSWGARKYVGCASRRPSVAPFGGVVKPAPNAVGPFGGVVRPLR